MMKNLITIQNIIPYKILEHRKYMPLYLRILLIIMFLYKHKLINRKTYVDMLGSFFKCEINDNSLSVHQWKKHLYVCNILNKFYVNLPDDIYFEELFIYLKSCIGIHLNESLTLVDLFEAIQMITNEPNETINNIIYNILNDIIDLKIETEKYSVFADTILNPIFYDYSFTMMSYQDFHPKGYIYDPSEHRYSYEQYKYSLYVYDILSKGITKYKNLLKNEQ